MGLRHPLVSAKQYATLGHLSGGRLVLGVGAGQAREEFEELGVDFEGRGAVLDESIDVLRAALGPEELPSHQGKSYDFEGLGQRPRPARPHVPVWVGGSSPAAVRRAALPAPRGGGQGGAAGRGVVNWAPGPVRCGNGDSGTAATGAIASTARCRVRS